MRTFLLLLLTVIQLSAPAQKLTTKEYKEDFSYFWKTLEEDYAYFDKKKTDWDRVKTIYEQQVDTVKSNWYFVQILEAAFRELYDDHASLNTNTPYSRRLVPSGADIWAAYINNKPIITEVRKGLGAEKVGIHAGMEVVAVNDIPIEKAVAAFIPKALKAADIEAHNYALRVLLAGNHVQARKLTLKYNNQVKDYSPDSAKMLLEDIHYTSLLESRINDNIGYIKINNSLFDNNLIAAFDSVMATMKNTKALILDLRETPSGGNTTVARAILGWFINKDHFYQKHELPAEEKAFGVKRSWEEIVSPRQGKYYSKPLIVLANHWTGSVGEGIAIAFDGMKRATVIGTELARLNGAIYSYQMPNTKIGFSFPAEKLYHINGTPREMYKPSVLIDFTTLTVTPTADPILEKAQALLKKGN